MAPARISPISAQPPGKFAPRPHACHPERAPLGESKDLPVFLSHHAHSSAPILPTPCHCEPVRTLAWQSVFSLPASHHRFPQKNRANSHPPGYEFAHFLLYFFPVRKPRSPAIRNSELRIPNFRRTHTVIRFSSLSPQASSRSLPAITQLSCLAVSSSRSGQRASRSLAVVPTSSRYRRQMSSSLVPLK